MLTYKAPLRDIKFLINDVFDYQTHYKSLDNGENADPETVDMILQGMADFADVFVCVVSLALDACGSPVMMLWWDGMTCGRDLFKFPFWCLQHFF